MDGDHPLARLIYIGMAAVAGAIVSLSFIPWKTMPWPDRFMTVFVGVAFAGFGVPWLVGDIMHVDIAPLRIACGVTFFGAIGANSFIPLILKKVRKVSGLEEGDVK